MLPPSSARLGPLQLGLTRKKWMATPLMSDLHQEALIVILIPIVAFFVRLFSLTNREVCCEIFLLERMEGNW